MTELKPCPFCMESDCLEYQKTATPVNSSCHQIYCDNCGTVGPEYVSDTELSEEDGKSAAIIRWNTNGVESLKADNARLRKGLAPAGYVVVPKEPTERMLDA